MLYENIAIIPFMPTSIMGLMETKSTIIPLGKHWPLQPQNIDLTDLIEPNQCEGELRISLIQDNDYPLIKIQCDTCGFFAERNSAPDMFDQRGVWTEKNLKLALARMILLGAGNFYSGLGCLRTIYQDTKKDQAALMSLLDTGLLTPDTKKVCLALLMPYRDTKWKILKDQSVPVNVFMNLADAGMFIVENLENNSRSLELANKYVLGYK